MQRQSTINMIKGVEYMQEERYSDASRKFLSSVLKTPKDSNAHMLYGASLYWLGDIEGAIKEYDKAIVLNNSNGLAFQLKGIALAWERRFAESLSNFLIAEKHNPERSDIKMNIGSLYHSMGKFSEALYYFRRAVKMEPQNSLYNFQLGLLYKRLGRYEEAKLMMEKAVKIDAYYEDAVFQLGIINERLSEAEEAISLYKRALAIKPQDGAARFRLNLALLKKGRKSEILENLQKSFFLTPANSKGGISLSITYHGERNKSGKNKAAKAKSPVERSLLRTLSRLPFSKGARIKISIMSAAMDETVSGKKGEKLASDLKKRFLLPSLNYRGEEFFLSPSSEQERYKEIKRILKKVNKMTDGRKGKFNISVNVETFNAFAGHKTSKARVYYNPRNIGNDKGLWIIGHNWLEDVEDGISELEEMENFQNLKTAVMASGFLLLGEFSRAEGGFSSVRKIYPLLYHLGMCIVAVGRGAEDAALKHTKKALEMEPENKIALSNLKWLKAPFLAEEKIK